MIDIDTSEIKIINEIEKDKISLCYLLAGPCEIKKKRIIDKLEEHLIYSGTRHFDKVVMWADEKGSLNQLNEFISSPPVNSKKKIIIVYRAEKLALKQDEKKLKNILNPFNFVCSVYITSIGERKTFLKSVNTPWIIKMLSKNSEICRTAVFLNPYPNERTKYIEKLSEEYSLHLSKESINLISDKGPESSDELYRLFDKISGFGDRINGDDIESLLASRDSIDQISFAIADRDFTDSFRFYSNALRWGHKPSEILFYISKYFTLLEEIKPYSNFKNNFAIQKALLKEKKIYTSVDMAGRLSFQTKQWNKKNIIEIKNKILFTMIAMRSRKSDEKSVLASLIGYIISS